MDAGDIYVILPPFVNGGNKYHKYTKHPRMPEGFSYCSDTNEQWLTVEEIRRLIQKLEG